MNVKPKTKLGRWSIGLNIFFLIIIIASIMLVKVFNVLDFDDTWWDVTATVFLAPIISLVLGIIALKKKENSQLVYLSIFFSALVVIFILLHSLFISD